MGRRSQGELPTMRRDASRNTAYVRLDGKRVRLGEWGSRAAQIKFDALVASWLAAGRDADTAADVVASPAPPPPPATGKITVADLLERWLAEIESSPTPKRSLMDGARAAGRALADYLSTPATDFGPKALKRVRDGFARLPVIERRRGDDGKVHLVERPRTVRHVNDTIGRVRQLFNWAVGEELIEPAAAWALRTVPDLRPGDSPAVASTPRQPVDSGAMAATLPALHPEVAGLVEFMALTGCRPGEACGVTLAQIHDRDQPTWRYVPRRHKNAWRGKIRHIAIGPKARAIIERQMAAHGIGPDEPIFSPRRVTRIKSDGTPGKPSPRVGAFYTASAMRVAVARACAAAGVQHWFPYMARYAASRDAERFGGVQTQMATLGQESVRMATHYAPPGFERAAEYAEANG
jgi:integrase